MTTAGIAGQFRTPRHIIKKMVEMLDPKPFERIADPACGTAGFLVESMRYLQKTFTSPGMEYKDEQGYIIYPGDLLAPYRDHIQADLLNGFDFDATMLRIASMNMILHNLEAPNINYTDTLSNKFTERFPSYSENYFDVILCKSTLQG